MSSIISRNCGLGSAPKQPRKVVLGVVNSPRELSKPILRKANRPQKCVELTSVTPDLSVRAAGMSQNVIVRKFKDMFR